MSGDQIRIFVAVELLDDVKSELAALITEVDALGVTGVRTVRPNGIHLTLKFLGDVDTSRVPDITSVMRDAASGAQPFDLALGQPGTFPGNPSAARVLWVGVDGEMDRLRTLQEDVEGGLESIGFKRDRRGFNPHLTIGRIRDRVSKDDRRLVTKVLSEATYARAGIPVESITLMQSILHPDGAIYESVHVEKFSV